MFLSSSSKNHTEGRADRKAAVPVLEKTAGQTEPKGEENSFDKDLMDTAWTYGISLAVITLLLSVLFL